jgi:diaminohydroxyphosphoribosylaminopyrimidine deaminase/5-amino-6-(5-phosphoribosylamino)uracil reductase
MTPEAAMRLALREAKKGAGTTFPNPCVGAVVIRGETVLGRGHTRPVGGAHAEIVAIERATRRHGAAALRGATLASTLEPCCHTGRTGPCSAAIVEAGISRVYVGFRDPHPYVAGGGLRRLKRAGVQVDVGVLEAECREQLRGFLSVCDRGRPWVVLKLASSLDGRIATASGESRWITGERSRAFVHRLRKGCDAVMVGSGTALADDPALTARRGEKLLRAPVRVLVDGSLRVPTRAQLYQREEGEAWVLCARGARGLAARERVAARVIEVSRKSGHLDLRAGLRKLGKAGLTQVLCEGGGQLAAALLRAKLVDEIHWMLAPTLIGGDGRTALGPLALQKLASATSLESISVKRLGEDVHIHGRTSNAR